MPTWSITDTEYVTIGGVPSATPAWRVLDLSPLWDGAEHRGDDRIVPGAAGVVAYPRRKTRRVVTLPMVFYSAANWENTAHSNRREGLYANIAYWRDNVVAPASGDGTRALVLHLPTGTRVGDAHVLGPMQLVPAGPHHMRATLDLSLPAGELVAPPPPP